MAGSQGFEPRQTLPKTVVLPLHHEPRGSGIVGRILTRQVLCRRKFNHPNSPKKGLFLSCLLQTRPYHGATYESAENEPRDPRLVTPRRTDSLQMRPQRPARGQRLALDHGSLWCVVVSSGPPHGSPCPTNQSMPSQMGQVHRLSD